VLVHYDKDLYDLKVRSGGKTSVIGTTSNHLFWVPGAGGRSGRWVKAGALKYGTRLHTPGGTGNAAVLGDWAPAQSDGWMWDLTVPGNNDHDFYVITTAAGILVHNTDGDDDCPTAGGNDPAARRVDLREPTKQAIQDAAPKTADGDYIDPNTGQVIPQDGPFDYGHTPGNEWWRTQEMARSEGWSREEVIEFENNPDHYQIEDPSSNRSHFFEEP